VAGEALIDFLPAECEKEQGFIFRPGGSPYNVAIGLGKLKVPVAYLGAVSKDMFGQLLLNYLKQNHVETKYVLRVDSPTGLSFVMKSDREGEPKYVFYGRATADTQLELDSLSPRLPAEIKAIHVGSLAMIRQPCGTVLAGLMAREHPRRLISFDPNVRPDQIPDRVEYQKKFARWLPMMDVLKLSQDDLFYIAPGLSEREVVEGWLSRGPKVVVVTLGQAGARGYTRSATVEVEAHPVKLVDSVGAGDAFTAGFLAALHHLGQLDKREIKGLDEDTLARALKFAARAAALTCSRRGADPPRLSELGPP
jgi:fructokinase